MPSPQISPNAPPASARYVIVNADDFGLTNGVNRGIIEAHERGIVTSASLMVRYPAAEEAAAYARGHAELSTGLHIDLAEWRYEMGEWRAAYQVVDVRDSAAVGVEIDRQLSAFLSLVGRPPTHLDSHQHVHRNEPVRSIAGALAARLRIPLRDCTATIRYCGDFYGQTGEGEPFPDGVSVARLEKLFSDSHAGWTEVGCHPGYSAGLDSVYRAEREEELRTLCSPVARAAAERNAVRLRSFNDFSV